MGYHIGDKVYILPYIEGSVGTIKEKVGDFIYVVSCSQGPASWYEEFTEDELKPYERPFNVFLDTEEGRKRFEEIRKNAGV